MAKTRLNSALKQIGGAIDQWVYRQFRGRTVIYPLPEVSQTPSAAQLAVRPDLVVPSPHREERVVVPIPGLNRSVVQAVTGRW